MTEPLIPVKVEIKEEDFDDFLHEHILASKLEDNTVLEHDCKTETQTSSTYKEEKFIPVDITEGNDSYTTNPISLAQMNRASVVLVDCCRPQGQRGTNKQTNGDAEPSETRVERITHGKSFNRGSDLNPHQATQSGQKWVILRDTRGSILGKSHIGVLHVGRVSEPKENSLSIREHILE
ncbi:hypothetical protein AALO_G00091020 [Alosa alosa]|uniref:Uncharacterized protein n=1 Tax=Alosa alosa TaxID=278164 RepID=A0AAV6GS29_9TELE|nr:hypothetical protein AALO_G00091020 [Alosa alosa]